MSLFQSCFALIESDACETADCAIQLLIMESYPSTSKKRFTGFNDKWITDPDFKEWIEKKNEFTAICKACNSDIAIQYEGRRALANCPGFDKFLSGNPIPIIGPMHHFLPIIGQFGPKANIFDLIGTLHEKFGPIVKMKGVFARADAVILFQPEDIDQVYRVQEANPLRPGFQTLEYFREVTKKGTLDGKYGLTTANFNPDKQEKLREEIRSSDPHKRYLRACLKEALRLWHVVPANLRRTDREHIVAGYLIPKGVDVIAPNEFLSRMEKYYPRSNEFIPERWLADKSDPLYYGNAPQMVTLPFGFGIRSCIGRRIAELEIETLMKRIFDEFKVTWEGPPIKVVNKVTNAFAKPFHFRFESAK